MDDSQRIAEARRRFSLSLVGYWSTAQGTFNGVMAQHWVFRSDGTGQFTDTGPFGYPRAETRFVWRQVADFEIELRITEYIAHQPNYAAELEPEDCEWQSIRYDFVVVRHDCGVEVGLVGGLLSVDAPLGYCGSISHKSSG